MHFGCFRARNRQFRARLHEVVEDSDGPAVVVGTDEGAVYTWDLSGHDKGQIYAEMRPLSLLRRLFDGQMWWLKGENCRKKVRKGAD